MKYQLVLQFPCSAKEDFDNLIEIENQLETKLVEMAEVDGHDFGSNEMNIFILTDNPIETFNLSKQIIKTNPLFNLMKSAYRGIDSSNYNILWPDGLNTFKVT